MKGQKIKICGQMSHVFIFLKLLREKSYFDQLAGRYKYCKELKNFKNTGTCSYTSILEACLVLNIENFSSVNTGETFFY